ncbi:mammalian cell entry protein [Mycolicibacterium novocastrense]|uniref:MCE family protein n=1 Tax=Mycolicibacterium novocastrense TaxID=59813 RepID=UPI00074B19CF|nr:MCE family protein [Mycolicibacterium novocastrense]KUH64474.1 mammalian cell entry protein [Mycolicibacterium novocastrense]KUH65221.1 mammalian cell entry protein [Mycolicibacterium novocastrense]KUH76272.1 mammalian cell entry protein [Mycolicibacterium novocastrense]
MRSPAKRLLFAVLAVLLVAATVMLVRQLYFPAQTITAYFSSATGLYPGDDVRIAGVKVGAIRSITPRATDAEVVLEVDRGIRVPADAKAVIVAQNLVAARYVQLAPLYRTGEARMGDGGVIPRSRTAVPVEWDEVKGQLSRLATELGPHNAMSTTSMGRFIESTAGAMEGNGEKLRQTFAQLSQLARILSDGSGDIVATIENLQTFVTALRDSGDDLVLFQDRLATFSTVLDDSRSDLDAALSELAVAVGEVQRFVGGTRDKTAEQVQRLANATQVLVDHRLDVENILHVAPTAFANAYNILNPNVPGAIGTFVFNNFSNPVAFICGAIGGIANITAPETAEVCAKYLGPAMRLLNFNSLPQPPLNPFLMPSVTPDKLVYTDPALAPGGSGGAAVAPEQPPAVSAYSGVPGAHLPGPAPAHSQPPGPAPALPDLLLPAEAPPAAEGTPP